MRDGEPLAFRAVRSGLWVLGASYWTIAFGFIANIGMTRLLSPINYGDFALATFFYSVFQLRGKLSLNYAFAQLQDDYDAAAGTYVAVDVLLGLGGLLIMVVAAPVLYSFGYSTAVIGLMLLMALTALVESTSSVFGATLSKQLHARPGSTIASIALPLSYAPAFWLALTGNGQFSLIVQYVAVTAIAQVGIWIYYVRVMRLRTKFHWRFRLATARHLLVFGGLIGTGAFIGVMGSQVDNFLIGTFLGAEALGYYDRAYRTAQWPNLLLSALIAHSAYYTYSRLQNDPMRLQKSVSMIFWICANIALPIALALIISAPDFIHLLYGERWLPSVPLLRILAAVAVVRPIWDNATVLLAAIGQARRVIMLATVQFAILLLAGWPLTILFGASGTALAVALSFAVGIMVLYIVLHSRISIHFVSIFGAPVMAAVATIAVYVVLTRMIDINTVALWPRVLGKGMYAVLAFFTFLFIFQPGETRKRVNYIWQMMRGVSNVD